MHMKSDSRGAGAPRILHYSAELKGPRKLLRIRTEIVDLGSTWAPKPDEQAKNVRGGARKPAQTDSDRFWDRFRVGSTTIQNFELRDSSAEIMDMCKTPGPYVGHLPPTKDGRRLGISGQVASRSWI